MARKRIETKLPETLVKKLNIESRKKGVPRTELLEGILREFLKRNEPKLFEVKSVRISSYYTQNQISLGETISL